MSVNYKELYPTHPADAKKYDTTRLREEFLADNILIEDEINMVYTSYDRFVVGGAVPASKELELEAFDSLKADFFCERREVGIVNVGGKGIVETDNGASEVDFKEGIYIGMGNKKITLKSVDSSNPARFYINSAPAHKSYPEVKITLENANVLNLGTLESSNERQINQMIVDGVVNSCQLVMGMTALKPGSVWNTMPAHTHNRRMEAYFYFEVPEDQSVCHFMGQPQETRHIWVHNEEAVISPSWSIHSAAGTSNYIFIWGMAGENKDYTDMDTVQPNELK